MSLRIGDNQRVTQEQYVRSILRAIDMQPIQEPGTWRKPWQNYYVKRKPKWKLLTLPVKYGSTKPRAVAADSYDGIQRRRSYWTTPSNPHRVCDARKQVDQRARRAWLAEDSALCGD